MSKPAHDPLLLDRLIGWLREQGIELTPTILRHAVGIMKSLETPTIRKQ